MSPREWEIAEIQSFWLASLSDEILNTRPGICHNTVHGDTHVPYNYYRSTGPQILNSSLSKTWKKMLDLYMYVHWIVMAKQQHTCMQYMYKEHSTFDDVIPASYIVVYIQCTCTCTMYIHIYNSHTFMSNPKPFFPLLLSMPVHSNRSTDPRELSFCRC